LFTDLWSFGIVLFELITGEMPWEVHAGEKLRQSNILNANIKYPKWMKGYEKDIC